MAMGDSHKETSLRGTSEVSLDPKSGRFNIPSDLQNLGYGPVNFTREPLGRFLEIRRNDNYEAFALRMEAAANSLDAEAAEALLVDYVGFTIQALVDTTYRVIIPKKMRECLGEPTSIVLVGVGDAIQIWPAEVYYETKSRREEALRNAYPKFGRHIVVRNASANSEEAA